MDQIPGGESQIINIILMAIGLLVLMGLIVVLFFYFSRRRIVKTELEKAHLEIEHQKSILQSTILTQEQERKRIAQDMHDAISSKLNVVSLNANMLADDTNTSEEARSIGETIQNVTATVLENSRRIAHDLLPPTLQKFGLQAALEELCEELEETGVFQLKSTIDCAVGALDKEHELHVFRIVQELFNNAIKHSRAQQIELSINTDEKALSLHYNDDGVGFDLKHMQNARGLGMSGIENRAELLSATLNIDSSPGQGLFVELTKK